MTPQQLIYKALDTPEIEAAEAAGACCLCGAANAKLDRKPFIKEGFTNLDRLMAPESPAICEACAYMFVLPKLRQSSWAATESHMIWLRREDLWDLLWSPPAPPFALYVTTSYKKHGSFKTRVNHSQKSYYIQFEEIGVTFLPQQLRRLADTMEMLYSVPAQDEGKANPISFFTKDEIHSGRYNQGRIKRYGITAFAEAEAILRAQRDTPAFGLLVYALNKKMFHREGIDWKQAKKESRPESMQGTLF